MESKPKSIIGLYVKMIGLYKIIGLFKFRYVVVEFGASLGNMQSARYVRCNQQ